MDAGSIWRKWDLHVHTPESYEHQYKFLNQEEKNRYHDNIWEKFIDKLEEIKNISVIGITDYFSIEGYKRVLEFREKGRLKNFDLILPNIELRLDKFVSSRRGSSPERLNYHVIFSNEINPNKIEKEFLEEFNIKIPNKGEIKLNKENIEEIGRILKEQHKSFEKKSEYFLGCMNITVSLENIIAILKRKEQIFNGKYLLVLPEEKWCLIDWESQDHLTRKIILINSHAIFSSNIKTRNWALGLGEHYPNSKAFINEFDSLKPCIHGSDAHDFEKLCKPYEDRYCWIKADPTFEGLKQILYEPEERVKIQKDNPENRKTIFTLSSIKIANSKINHKLSFKEEKIPLNSNMVAITGGKGSGKTAMLDLIANCFEDRCMRSINDKNSFIQRIEQQKPDLKIELDFIGQDIKKFSKEIKEENFFLESKITYLPQGKIEEYCGDRVKLENKIEEIIFNNKEVKAKDFKQKFDVLKSEIDKLEKEIDNINREIYNLEEKTKNKIIKEIEHKKSIKEGELKNKQDELDKLPKSPQAQLIEELGKERNKLFGKLLICLSLKEDLHNLKKGLSDFLENANKLINRINKDLREIEIDSAIPIVNFDCNISIIDIALDDVHKKESHIAKNKNEKEEKLREFSGISKAHSDVITQIEEIKAEIRSFTELLRNIAKMKEEIKLLENEREQHYFKLIKMFFEWKEYYKEVIQVFSKGKSKIMSGVYFESSIYFNKEKFIKEGTIILDLRSIHEEQIKQFANSLEMAMNEDEFDRIKTSIKDFLKTVLDTKKILLSTRTSYDFYKWIFSNYFSLNTTILFKKIPMDKLSIGQKGTVLLKLFLAEGDYPLIIDQPDEHLDNKFIYEELVGAFREAKKKRQILIATNNGNLVVNTDSEQIIVAEFENNIISYNSGTLENLKLRKLYIPVLDGGEEAFKKRAQKYGL